jgi:hypothetical protein
MNEAETRAEHIDPALKAAQAAFDLSTPDEFIGWTSHQFRRCHSQGRPAPRGK